MKPSSLRMRASSSFSLEAGTSTFCWRARMPLRMRVKKSATGSVKLIVLLLLCPFAPLMRRTCGNALLSMVDGRWSMATRAATAYLPGRLGNAGDFAPQRQATEAQAANAELAQESAGTPADLAAVVLPAGEDSAPIASETWVP